MFSNKLVMIRTSLYKFVFQNEDNNIETHVSQYWNIWLNSKYFLQGIFGGRKALFSCLKTYYKNLLYRLFLQNPSKVYFAVWENTVSKHFQLTSPSSDVETFYFVDCYFDVLNYSRMSKQFESRRKCFSLLLKTLPRGDTWRSTDPSVYWTPVTPLSLLSEVNNDT